MSDKTCYLCLKKLSLVEITVGLCKCTNYFCKKHKIPESHNCVFNFQKDFQSRLSSNMQPIVSKKVATF